MKKLLLFIFGLVLVPACGGQVPPPLGWSSWSSSSVNQLNATYAKAQADVMADKLKASGYVYINLDYGWSKGFDEHGRAKVNTDRFPGGITALAQYVHEKGLKLGVYLLPGMAMDAWKANGTIEGTNYHVQDIADPTQQGNTEGHAYKIDFTKPGAKEYIQSYADLLASWGVDYIKMDFVGPGGGNKKADTRDDMKEWHDAILKTGRPMWLELSNSLSIENIETWKATSNGWRIEGDIENYGSRGKFLTNWGKVKQRFNDAPKWARFAAPGNWNDLDCLELGQGDADGLTPDERKTAMTLWAISCSPILLGANLTKLDDGDLSLLTNPEVLAVDQAGYVAVPLSQKTSQQVWHVKNPDGSVIVALFNLGDEPGTVGLALKDLNLSESVMARDLWLHTDLAKINSQYEVHLLPHGCQLLRLHP